MTAKAPMTILKNLCWTSTFILAACSTGEDKFSDLSDIPTLEIVATHAIETKESIKELTFIPNEMAPWLGRLVTSHPSGSLYSTDIEGRNPHKTGTKSYSSIYGLSRSGAPGVFLTTNTENKLEAFIEKNDEGHFSAMRTSGTDVNIETFCKSLAPSSAAAAVLTTNHKVLKIKTNIEAAIEGQIPGLEYTIEDEVAAPKTSRQCAISDETIYTVSGNPDFQTLHIYSDGKWSKFAFPAQIDIAPISFNKKAYLLVITDGKIYLFDADSKTVSRQLLINSGLSIEGLNQANMVSATQSNFGGAAFSEGLIGFGQADKNRIVFVSRFYLAAVLKESES